MDPSIGQIISHFRILGRLSGGRVGMIFKAEDSLVERIVTVRFLSEGTDRDALKRFEAQAAALSALGHPHIAEVYEVGEWEGRPFLAREMLEGELLRKRMNERPLGLPEILDVGAQMADALEAAHGAGFFHGDFKPENAILNRRGEVKVFDFGLARLITGLSPTSKGATPDGGMSAYFSPEQQRGDPIYARSDIFSLGAVLYELAARRPAFAGRTVEECIHSVLDRTPPPPSQFNPEVPERFDEIAAKAMEKGLELRYQTAVEMRTDLRRLRRDWEADRIAVTRAALVEPAGLMPGAAPAQGKAQTAPVAAGPSAADTGSRRRWMWIAAGLLLAAAGGAIAVRIMRPPDTRLPAVFRKLTYRRGWISSARFSFDGRVAFYSADWNGPAPDIFAVRPEASEPEPMVEGQAEMMSVSSKGELAVLRQVHVSADGRVIGKLEAVPAGGGTPRPILDEIEAADWAPDGGQVAIVRRVSGTDRLEYPPGTVLRKTTGWIGEPRFSPKGDEIAYVEHPVLGEEKGSVEIVDLSGKDRVLTRDWKIVRGLAWSPKGDEVWFTATRSSALQLYAVNLAGQPRQVGALAGSVMLGDIAADGRLLLIRDDVQEGLLDINAGELGQRDLSWTDRLVVRGISSDGKTALVEVAGAPGVTGDSIYLRATDGSRTVRVGDGEGLALSPDGQWVLAQDEGAPDQLVMLPIGKGEAVRLTPAAVTHEWAAWLPDGKGFVFLGHTPGHRRQLFVQERSGGQVRAFSPEGVGGSAALSPDGKWVAAIGPDGQGHLYPVDGGVVPTIHGLQSVDRPVGWSRDGLALFVADGSVPLSLYRLDLSGGTRKLLWHLNPADRAGVTGITGVAVTPDGRFCVYSYSRTLSTLYLAEGLE